MPGILWFQQGLPQNGDDVLHALLNLMGRGGIQQPSSLAAELAVPVDLVEQMLTDLERLGYLQVVGDGCSPSVCAHCANTCTVTLGNSGRSWVLTTKGARAIAKG